MMHVFLAANRLELERRCREKVMQRPHRAASPQQLEQGVPLFIDQLIRTLRAEADGADARSEAISGTATGDSQQPSELGRSAANHGADLLRLGYSINQVVHDYGDVCQAVSDLALEQDEQFDVEEFRTLNRCLDNGIADAVTGFSQQRELLIADRHAGQANERLGVLAHELRNHLNTATLALTVIRTSNVGVVGATGAVLDRSLVGLRTLIDRSLAEVRVEAGMAPQLSQFSLATLLGEAGHAAALEARLSGCAFSVAGVTANVALNADKDLLLAALGNLLQNAIKFSGPRGSVWLSAGATEADIWIEVADNGPGLSNTAATTIFQPFTQGGSEQAGLGLGLSIARRGVEANGGTLALQNTPGLGCVFTVTLPRRAALSAVAAPLAAQG